MDLRSKNFEKEFSFIQSRSSGPGGQNVNKVNTKVELRFNVLNSELLSESEKISIVKKLGRKISNEGELYIVSQSARSQLQNRQKTIDKFYILLQFALTKQKKRIKTMPTKSSVQKRLEQKKHRSREKTLRNKVIKDIC